MMNVFMSVNSFFCFVMIFCLQFVFWSSTCTSCLSAPSIPVQQSINDYWTHNILCHRALQFIFAVCACWVLLYIFSSLLCIVPLLFCSPCLHISLSLALFVYLLLSHSFSKDYSEIWGWGLWKSMLCSVAVRLAAKDLYTTWGSQWICCPQLL